MQHNGTLRKRKRRNIAKVTGLLANPDGEYGGTVIDKNPAGTLRTIGRDIPVFKFLNESRSKRRVTRDPSFHEFLAEENLGALPHKLGLNKACNNVSCHQSSNFNKCTRRNVPQSRTYFLDPATMSRLKQIILLAICSGTVPWRFNSQTHTVERWSPRLQRWWRYQWYFVTLQTAFLTGFQFYSFISRIEFLQDRGNRELFMNSVSLYWYICALYFNINMYRYEDKIRHYINTLFRFNRDFVEKYVIHLDDYVDGGRLVINLSIPSNTCQVFASVALFLVIPYQPWYLFSYLHPKPFYWLIPGAIHEFVLVGQVISNYILYQWIMVAHSNSLEFWLKEMHNQHETGYTNEKLRDYDEGVKCYRKLQILCSCFNKCMTLAIPLLKTHIFTGLVPCGYVVIRSLNEKFIEEFPGILTYPICVIDCATAGFTTLSLAAEVFDLAAGFLDSWSRTKKKEFRRVLMSCPALKVWVGRFYFITVTTTITFFKVTTDFIINAVIAFP